jgi:GTP cyclohydrolase FolE2
MNAPEHFFLPDVQSAADTHRLAIQNVGVKGLRYPLQLESASGETINTVASLTMTVGLPPEVKGTHMSRFVELLEGRRLGHQPRLRCNPAYREERFRHARPADPRGKRRWPRSTALKRANSRSTTRSVSPTS